MKNNEELRATLTMVLARLDSEPKSVEEWQTIQDALRDSLGYATKVKVMRVRLAHPACRVDASDDR